MSTDVAIPIAGFKDVYDVGEVEKALHELPPSANEALRALYEKMLRLGGQRFTVKPSALPSMEHLFEDLPNFGEVLADIRKHLALCIDSNDSIELPPMLLLGDPGIGKTHFARKIAELLGTGFGFVPMSSLTAGWVLSGASSQWKNAKPGKVFDTFMNGVRRIFAQDQPVLEAQQARVGRKDLFEQRPVSFAGDMLQLKVRRIIQDLLAAVKG